MSSSHSGIPAYGAPSQARPDRLPWSRVVVRMFLVILPGQLVGSFAATTALTGSGVLRDRPGLALLITVLAGLVAGVGVGVLLHPARDQLVSYALVAAAIGLGTYLLLFGLAQLRAAETSAVAPLSSYLRALLVLVLSQALGAVPLWVARSRGRT